MYVFVCMHVCSCLCVYLCTHMSSTVGRGEGVASWMRNVLSLLLKALSEVWGCDLIWGPWTAWSPCPYYCQITKDVRRSEF